ncbi:DUF1707 domain-containing protein [Prescottella equi]|uniref:DUF1707 domain-containing protein n=1 Tax=Rhodococcus hoagii TaxID=43767 RepID=A0A9Q2UNS9_RHOHA|nr:DUF1707 domain-containing protein [Prescottella equi]MBM4481159.1 DUF1707 domain-containing protein [Prescottella equi]MBM4491994.1 DUF1707 domain-containing protein [Prescottella equi]MBM4497803.1 DUF1707 domain-containing protein [Prescottella equi]MBM4506788.1 DUF1707 domain-containing protein [Prescottella equi]MBM4513775.1 DUF1707 domain-containing protein [Prescottella equi]
MSDVPEIRIGTAEREQALAALSQHFSDGRLTVVEFDERSGRIAAATTRGQLDEVFSDLPSLTPSAPSKVSPEPADVDGEKTWRNTVMAVIPFVALALFFVVPIDNSWLFFLLIPATAAILFGGRDGRKGRGSC